MNLVSSSMSRASRRGWRSGLLAWLCGWLLAAGFVGWHALSVERYLDRVTATRFSEEPLGTRLQRVPQAVAPDGQVWIRHALALAESDGWRLRSTEIDNAPDGRPVYWNSAWALWLEACGRVRKVFTGESLAGAIEAASLWANFPLFLIVMTLASGWVWRRWGGAAGALTAVALAGHRTFYEGFYPAYPDHHGLISASVLGVVLGALLAGAGWWRRDAGETASPPSLLPKSEDHVLRAVTVSAVCGALGMWVSAASLVVTIAFTGVAVVVGAWVFGTRAQVEGAVCVSRAWQRWGRVGAALSVGFYLLENFPDRLGLRLEANHPLYSLAWWSAGEAMAAVLVWRTEQRGVKWLWPRLAGWGTGVLIAPFIVWVKGVAVFGPLDPFLARIHESIHEFEPLSAAIDRAGWKPYGDQLWAVALILVLSVVWLVRKPSVAERMLAACVGAGALAATALGFYQNRWLLTASGAQIVLVLVLVVGVTARLRPGWRGVAFVAAGALFYTPGPWMLATERRLVERVRDVQLGETMQLLYRDVAGALRRAGADGSSVVLSNPNASVGVGYYGRLRTVGTLYWENRDGLRAAAEIFGARDDAEAAARVHAHGITHVVLFSSYDFLAEYSYALQGGLRPVDAGKGFGHRLLYEHRVPVWLRPIDYAVPAPLAPLGFKVAIFAVDFVAPASVAHERIGLYQLEKGARSLAETSFMAALMADSTRPAPWVLQGELLLSAGRVAEAFNFIRAGIDRAPANERAALLRAAAGAFARQGSAGQAKARELLERAEP